ncbi:membrane or secreted protein [Aureibaculum luteum]|uniref:membrane or secreted protein n=1 Tax=Aureibaculum luteum TaxID=1548456 RepID=UPI001E3B4E1E|nr:membrane or secreted protein [Aureibaculum luteum]
MTSPTTNRNRNRNRNFKSKRIQTGMALLIFAFLSFTSTAQNIIGAWESISTAEGEEDIKVVVIFSDGYQVLSAYNSKTGKFIGTNGGTWKLEGDTMTEKIEFDSGNTDRVGTETNFKVTITDSIVEIGGSEMKLKRIDNGKPGKLQGAWLMSGRVKDGETQSRDTNKPRKTMKILSGTRFQWIAYNTETKEFMGTGGGTYTTENGKYTENIEFFSKDDTRVGNSLQFDFSLKEGNWNHSGLSSKGAPIHEIWSVRE